MLQGKIKSADETSIIEAATLMRSGQAIVFPTETVYGLGTSALNDEAVDRIYQIKSRDEQKPLQILVENVKIAKKYGVFNEMAEKLAKSFWPGPLTLVIKKTENSALASNISPGIKTIGIRIPAHDVTAKLLRLLKGPIASTSANISGVESSTNALEAAGSIGALVPFVIDGGRSTIGVSSTVVDVSGKRMKILREGSISEVELRQALSTT